MNKFLKIWHLLGLAVFVGSIFVAAKLGLVTLIALNGALILTPLSRDMANAAQTSVTAGALPAGYSELKRSEDLFGAANLAMIFAVIGLAVAKPSLGRRNSIKTGQVEASL